MNYIAQYFSEVKEIVDKLNMDNVELMLDGLIKVRNSGGRLFIIGVGGSAGNAGHAVNDFRKIAGFEAYAPTDNVSELSARTNDNGWHTVFVDWLKGSRLNEKDALLVFSVGGGDVEKNVSPNIVYALKYAKEVGARVFGIVGRDGGYTAKVADACVVVPMVNSETVTPHAESFQTVVWHLFVSHPKMKTSAMKWESIR